jgi:hypothetical protein
VHREYFSIIFNVKKCTLYSIKYGTCTKSEDFYKKLRFHRIGYLAPISRTTYHFSTTPQEDGDGLGVVALFDHQHPVLGGAEVDLANQTCLAQLVGT